MRICGWIILWLLMGSPVWAQVGEVVRVKEALQAAGVDLGGACGALRITKGVAGVLVGQGAGLRAKPEGNQCEGYSVDVIVFLVPPRIVDVLVDAGGANVPAWQEQGVSEELARMWWRRPLESPPGEDEVLEEVLRVRRDLVELRGELVGVRGDVLRVEEEVKATHEEVKSFRESAKDYVANMAKYAIPLIGALLGGIAVGQ